jgi:Tol biopolymer transport system component
MQIGAKLGAYEVIAKLGEGGMGEVYRARDTKLGRDVAIKTLPELFVDNPERVARFEREAQILAALNHPHIAAIYGLEESAGSRFLVLEYVDGESLADRIAKSKTGLGVDEALAIARQIVDALEAAHDKGIIHRDLKPGNVMLTAEGAVKVLDFGLAKQDAGGPDGSVHLTHSPTISLAATQAGVILGTAAYMAPEQAKGRASDKRSDVWAFGCVLYEMLTGRRAFDGEDLSDTLAAVLRAEPDWNAFPKSVPDALGVIVRRCLEKDRKTRIPDVAVVRYMLDDAKAAKVAPSGVSAASSSSPRGRRGWVAAGVLGAAFVATASWATFLYLGREPAERAPTRFTTSPGLLTTAPGINVPLAVSPDGRKIAFVGLPNASTRRRLFVRPLDSLTAQELPGTDDASGPFWSPDSRFVAFFADGKLKKIDTNGGPAVPLCDAPSPRGGAWSTEGFILFGSLNTGKGLQRVAAGGGVPAPVTTLAEGETGHIRPSFLPGGRHFLYRTLGGVGGPVYIASIDSPDHSMLIEQPDASNVVYASGHLLFLRERTLMAQPFDAARRALTGEPVPVAEEVATFASPGSAVFSASQNGVLAYQEGGNSNSALAWFDRTGKPLGRLGDAAPYGDVELSPDGGRVAVSVLDQALRTRDIWIVDVARGFKTPFTFDAGDEYSSSWSPDGSRIAFSSQRGRFFDLYVKPSNGAGSEEVLLSDDVRKHPMRWSPDGRYLPYVVSSSLTSADLWILPLTGDRKPFPFVNSNFNEAPGQLSHDGRWMAYVSNESKVPQVWVAPFPSTGAKSLISSAGGTWPRWRADGRELFYLSPDNQMMAASLTIKADVLEVGEVRPLFPTRPMTGSRYAYDVTKDGKRFLVNTTGDQDETATPITVVVNWNEQPRRLAPPR